MIDTLGDLAIWQTIKNFSFFLLQESASFILGIVSVWHRCSCCVVYSLDRRRGNNSRQRVARFRFNSRERENGRQSDDEDMGIANLNIKDDLNKIKTSKFEERATVTKILSLCRTISTRQRIYTVVIINLE